MKRYSVVYVDPPWQYSDKCHAGKRGADYKYMTMAESELLGLDVSSVCSDDCALFMWTTAPMMPVAISVMESWGFAWKTVAFTWVKRTKNWKLFWGMGSWSRANPEYVLLGVRGKPKVVSHSVHSVVEAMVGKHSAKPVDVYGRIEELLGDVPRLELFARGERDGWDQTGLEYDGLDVREFLNK